MKAKILLISTRWIHETKSIFSDVKRCNPNSALKEYFYAVSNIELRKLLAKKRESQHLQKVVPAKAESALLSLSEDIVNRIYDMLPAWLQGDPKLNDFYGNDEYSSFLKKILDEIRSKYSDEDYKDQKDLFDEIIETISPYLGNGQDDTKNEELPPFVFSCNQDDFVECSDCNAVNLDKDTSTGITIADRVSLYKVMENLYEDKDNNEQILFMVYAVWPLGNSNKDKPSDKDKDSVKWIDQLTIAIKEECKETEVVELILLLHDNDLASTAKTPLKTVDIDSLEETQGIKRTIAVYQHSNIKFISLVSQGNEKNAKTIYDEARKFIVDDLIFQQLAKMSHLLANYSGSKENESIKAMIDWLKIHIKDEHDPKGYLNTLAKLCSSCYNNNIMQLPCLIEANSFVNNLIKEIVIPEKYKCQ